ncbi:MAG: DUF21 domain-containing protein [Ectothiorhodospiraceae bacterium]|nr:DUF21 domain-containing protein [Ectothiorhodospiraceae bacterium]
MGLPRIVQEALIIGVSQRGSFVTLLTWIGILICLTQSAMLSGLNLGLFSLGRLELSVEARKGNPQARRMLELRKDANLVLVTILWGNVGVNVILALLSGSVMVGVVAFLFSTVIITVFAEIIPQAYFTRNALRVVSLLAPVLLVYRVLLYPVARPTAWVLDRWLGGEAIRFLPERDLRQLIQLHMDATDSEIDRVEGQGALNFLELDDVPLAEEGEPVDPNSILQLPFDGDRPVFPSFRSSADDDFLQAVNRASKTWVVITDDCGTPRLVLNADGFIRDAIFGAHLLKPYAYCHRPIVTRDPEATLGSLIQRYRVRPGRAEDIVDDDVILLWGMQPRIVTGTDIMGRLLRGIARPPG